ncbi:MAG TPA: GNAT family N-acetyltransferase [Patescibacteria group bacterium]|nr:GNAT family N-acetyltransferase [Patescibacteria group bacterium]
MLESLLCFKHLSDESSILNLLESSKDYFETIEGISPDINTACSILYHRPPGVNLSQKNTVGIFYNQIIIGLADMIFGYPKTHTVYIGLLLISPNYRKTGIGRISMRELERHIVEQGYDTLRIAVVRSNAVVKEFWRKIGFIETGEVKEYRGTRIYSTCEIMEKTL